MKTSRSTTEQSSEARSRPKKELIPRKKACKQCSVAKVRCDIKRPQCSRCETRGTRCEYAVSSLGPADSIDGESSSAAEVLLGFALDSAPATEYGPRSSLGTSTTGSCSAVFLESTSPSSDGVSMTVGYSGQTPATRSVPIPCSQYNEGDQRIYGGTNNAIDFTKVDLVCTVDSSRVRNRWLEAFLPSENQRPKNFPTCIVLLLSRVFKTYPRMMLRQGGLPPFIHPAQLAGQELPIPLANCFSIARMWDGQVRGSETLVREIIRREMNRLHTERRSYDQMTLLAASQAFLIYAIMLFFASDIGDSLVDRQTLINLLEFACDITSTGTMCPAEFSDTRPDWPSWIVASAKRRTLYTMYMLDNLFCSLNSLPYYIAEELESLPAPASKVLWEASRKDVWEKEYNIYLAEWIGGGLTIDELWPVSETGALERRKRVDKWLESVDEFGMMLYAVTLATHGV